MLRVDPLTFQSWSLEQWQYFFDSLLNDGNGWSSRGSSVSDLLRPQTENRRLRQDAEYARKQSEANKTQAADLQRSAG